IELSEDGRIEDGISAANGELAIAARIPGEAEARAEIGVDVGAEGARLAIPTGVHGASEQSGDGILCVGIEVAVAVIAFKRLLLEVIAQAEIERHPACDFPIVLNKEAGGVSYLGLTEPAVSRGAADGAENKGREPGPGAGRRLRIRREVGIECEGARRIAALPVVPAQETVLHAGLHGVAALDLGHDVSEVPVQRAARADGAIADRRESEIDDRKQVGGGTRWAAEPLRQVLNVDLRDETERVAHK